jgi:hypothetical protein
MIGEGGGDQGCTSPRSRVQVWLGAKSSVSNTGGEELGDARAGIKRSAQVLGGQGACADEGVHEGGGEEGCHCVSGNRSGGRASLQGRGIGGGGWVAEKQGSQGSRERVSRGLCGVMEQSEVVEAVKREGTQRGALWRIQEG